MEKLSPQKIIDILEPFVSDHKRAVISSVLDQRTRQVTLVFEDIDKPHNISAVLRTAECMGLQDLHFIQNNKPYTVNKRITKGAAKWVSMHHYADKKADNLDECYRHLRNNGYKIYATSLHQTSISIDDLDAKQPTAIVFGTESAGISEQAGQKADGLVHIPMAGFTESFNLSVSAAICLSIFKRKSKQWSPLSPLEKLTLKADWYQKVVRASEKILVHQTT